jgi:hypothetical protein
MEYDDIDELTGRLTGPPFAMEAPFGDPAYRALLEGPIDDINRPFDHLELPSETDDFDRPALPLPIIPTPEQ